MGKTYTNSISKNGEFSPKISNDIARKVDQYCKLANKNKTKYVEECISRCVDQDIKRYLDGMSKEQLVGMLIGKAEQMELKI